MSALENWRRELRGLIPEGFLRRDRGDMLFASDYPSRLPRPESVTEALTKKGYRVIAASGIARISPGEDMLRRFFESLPCPGVAPTDENLFALSLAERLLREDAPLAAQDLDGLIPWLKKLDAGDTIRAMDDLAALMAVLLRKGRPLPGAAGKLILCTLAEREGGNNAC